MLIVRYLLFVSIFFIFQTSGGYFDLFEDTWKVFSKHPLKFLSDYKGKMVRLEKTHRISKTLVTLALKIIQFN